MFYKINKKSNTVFLEKSTRDKLEKLFEELIKQRKITVGVLDSEKYLEQSLVEAFNVSGLSYEQFKMLMFGVLESATDKYHTNNVVMIDSAIKCYRLNDYYFIIRRDAIAGNENLFMQLIGFPPKNYTSIIEYDPKKETRE